MVTGSGVAVHMQRLQKKLNFSGLPFFEKQCHRAARLTDSNLASGSKKMSTVDLRCVVDAIPTGQKVGLILRRTYLTMC